MPEYIVHRPFGDVSVRQLPGDYPSRIRLKCDHIISHNKTLREFQAKKGEVRECPEGCGPQGIKQVERIRR